jgi:hypothetical protein
VKYIWTSWVEEGFRKLDEINAMDIPFPEKIERMFDWKQQFTTRLSTEFIEEIIAVDLDLEKIKHRFLQYIVDAQNNGDIRMEIRPEFLAAVLDRLYDLARDEKLLQMYPSAMDFRREIKDFFWYGIIAKEA